MEIDVDVVSVAIRALSFIVLMQASGLALFIALFGKRVHASRELLRSLGISSTVTAIALVVLHHLLEAGRMAGEFGGVLQMPLQALTMNSSAGAANTTCLVGLLLIAVGLARKSFGRIVVVGALLASWSFLLTGHTAIHAQRWLLAPALALHLIAVAFWFGALMPLCIVSKREAATQAAGVIATFTAIATWLVPFIALAGFVMALVLLPNMSALLQPYGVLLLIKLLGFAILMGLATLNKWRLGPALAKGSVSAGITFRRSVLIEFAIICVILCVTAAMTGLFSPEA